MERMLETMEVKIPAGRTLRIRDARGTPVRIVEGTGWITEEDDPEDYALGPGDSRTIGTQGLTLAHAFEDTRIELSGRATVELGSHYGEYAAAVWHEQLRSAAASAMASLRAWLARGGRAARAS